MNAVHVETLKAPVEYAPHQLDRAITLAQILNRGRLLLVEKPEM